ncbi:hypothetical protein E2320_000769 [Naja naja]|nr:hypothetical protein E2320_000769 [Naja naja]
MANFSGTEIGQIICILLVYTEVLLLCYESHWKCNGLKANSWTRKSFVFYGTKNISKRERCKAVDTFKKIIFLLNVIAIPAETDPLAVSAEEQELELWREPGTDLTPSESSSAVRGIVTGNGGNEYAALQKKPGSGAATVPEPQTGAGVEEQAESVMANAEGLLAEAVPLAGLEGLETVPEAAREAVGDAGWNHEERKQSDSGSHISSASEFEGCKTVTGVQKVAWIKSGAGKGVLSEAGKVAGKGAEAEMEDGTGVETGSGKGAWAGAGGFPPMKDEVVSGKGRLQEVSAALKATEREEEKGRNSVTSRQTNTSIAMGAMNLNRKR